MIVFPIYILSYLCLGLIHVAVLGGGEAVAEDHGDHLLSDRGARDTSHLVVYVLFQDLEPH